MQNKDLISVVLPTYDHQDRLPDLLDLIHSLLSPKNSSFIGEIIIVDNGDSLTNHKHGLKLLDERIRIISEPHIGLNYARNTGISNTNYRIVSFLDDDTTVSQYWAENIVRGYSKDGVLCVGGPVLEKSDLSRKKPHWFSNYFVRFLLPPTFPTQAGFIRSPYYLIGANMSFKKDVFDKFGVFDNDLDRKGKNLLSNGDIEFIMRIPESSVWYEPDAIVFEKIPKKRLTRLFMVRRLFWQGVSDYIMVNKRGLDNFYDKKEILLTLSFLRNVISTIVKGRLFEAFCIFVRQFGFRYAVIYSKIKK